jgi:hypothetical protein
MEARNEIQWGEKAFGINASEVLTAPFACSREGCQASTKCFRQLQTIPLRSQIEKEPIKAKEAINAFVHH